MGNETVPHNQFRAEWHGTMTPDGYEAGADYRCNYCDKLCYYGETFGHSCTAYAEWLLKHTESVANTEPKSKLAQKPLTNKRKSR